MGSHPQHLPQVIPRKTIFLIPDSIANGIDIALLIRSVLVVYALLVAWFVSTSCSNIDNALASNEAGTLFATRGMWNEALDEYNTAISIKTDFAEAYNNRGAAYLAIGKVDKSILDFQQAIKLSPDLAIAHINLAASHLDLSQTTEAMQHLDDVLKLHLTETELASTYFHLGRAHFKLEDYEAIIKSMTD